MKAEELAKIVLDHHVWLNTRKGQKASLSYAKLKEVDLSGINLSNMVALYVDLSGANLSNMDLSCADLSDADLSNTDLSGANLSGAYLSGANLSKANLSKANLSNTQLVHTDLSYANLSGANLTNAKFAFANLVGTSLDFYNGIDMMIDDRIVYQIVHLLTNQNTEQCSDYVKLFLQIIPKEIKNGLLNKEK